MSDGTRFDPRFDPAFQPGYEGPLVPAATPTRRGASETDRIGTPPAARTAVRPAEPTPAGRATAAPVSAEPVTADEPHFDDDEGPRRPNPFLIALGAVAVLLVGGGLYLASFVRDTFADNPATSQVDYVVLQVLMYAAPLVVVLGLAVGAGILFVLAARWYRR